MTEGDTYSIMRGGGTRQGAEQEHHMRRLERQYVKAEPAGSFHGNHMICGEICSKRKSSGAACPLHRQSLPFSALSSFFCQSRPLLSVVSRGQLA